MSTQTGYRQDIEVQMKRLFATLSKKDRRRYVVMEAAKLGVGVITGLFKTVRRGLPELALPIGPAQDRVRKRRWMQTDA